MPLRLTDVTAWSLNRSDFEELALRYPILALNFSRVVSRHLRESTLRGATTVQVIQAPPPAPAPAKTAAVTGALVGLNRAADSTTSWWGRTSTGGKLRLIAVILLLIWLLGVAAPSLVISLLSNNGGASPPKPAAQSGFRDRMVLVALAADLPIDVTPTYTPWPTETPMPTRDLHPDGHADRDADPDGDLYAGPADRNPGPAHRGARAGCGCARLHRSPAPAAAAAAGGCCTCAISAVQAHRVAAHDPVRKPGHAQYLHQGRGSGRQPGGWRDVCADTRRPDR